MAMVEALADGLIDVVGSFHTPQDEEEKRLPFEEAARRRRRPRDAAAGRDAALPRRPPDACPRSGGRWRSTRRGCSACDAGRLAPGRPGRPRPLRPRHALRPRPRHAALEVEEHPLRPPPHAGPGARAPGSAAARSSRRRRHDPRPRPPLLAYLLGSIPFGVLITRALGLGDLRSIGSGNIGATNVLRTGNKARRRRDAAARRRQGRRRRAARPRASPARPRRWSRASPPSSATSSRSGSASGAARASRPSSALMLALAWPAGLAACATWLAAAFAFRYSSLAALVAAARPRSGWRSSAAADAVWLGARARGAGLRPPPRQHPPAARRHRAADRREILKA